MAQAPLVAVVGLAALRRDLNRMGTDLNSPLYAVLKAGAQAAADPIASRARSSLPHLSGRLAGDVRVSTTKTGATIRMGRRSIPYAGWIEFGGSRPDGSERPYLPNGRYLFPSAQSLATQAAATYTVALEKVLNSGLVWTNTGTNPGSVHD